MQIASRLQFGQRAVLFAIGLRDTAIAASKRRRSPRHPYTPARFHPRWAFCVSWIQRPSFISGVEWRPELLLAPCFVVVDPTDAAVEPASR